VQRVWRDPDHFHLDPAAVPAEADLVVTGNPNNPTGTLDPATTLAGLARPGRVLVVDEAFMEFTAGETETLAGQRDLPGLVVVHFLLLGVADGPPVLAGLAARGIAVRPCHNFPGITTNHLRVAVRDPADNQRLVDALAEALDPEDR
jgi:histidinol-phosphate/aromatic aminotransferase/cobyric acid decarboxylase-like protein